MSSAGDVLLTSPLLKLIKEREPESAIHFVVKSQYADLVRSNPNVTELHIVQDHADFHQLENLRRQLIVEKFSITLDLHNNFRSIYLRRGTAPTISVVKKDILRRAILVNSRLNLFTSPQPVALKYARAFDKSIKSVPRPEIYFPDPLLKKVDAIWESFGRAKSPSLFLCPGARHFTKRWPVQYWKELGKKMSGRNRVALLGGIEDVEACREIQSGTDIVNFCGQLSLLESSAMLRHASLVVTNDSYLMHAANALGVRTVAIFGSSVKEFGFFPYEVEHRILEVNGLTCRPCSHIGLDACPKRHFRCMMDTTPDKVGSAVASLMVQ